MNIIRRHKWLAIIGGLTLILFIVMFAIFAKMIFSNGDSEYGQRLNGFIKVDKKIIKEIINETKELENVVDIEIRTQGKIIYTTIEFLTGTNLDAAKGVAKETLAKYDENNITIIAPSDIVRVNLYEITSSGETLKQTFSNSSFTQIGTTGWAYKYYNIGTTSKTYKLVADKPIGVQSYGYYYQTSYAYPLGLNLTRLNNTN